MNQKLKIIRSFLSEFLYIYSSKSYNVKSKEGSPWQNNNHSAIN